jgi:DNA repair photolyase
MAALLKGGVEVAFLTKGAVGERFLFLFAKTPARAFAQVGITTLDHRLWEVLEPGTASPSQRLDMIERLTRTGIATSARLDPLIPDLTDTEASLTSLLSQLQLRNVRSIAASYLFLRPAFANRLITQMGRLGASLPSGVQWSWRRMAAGLGGAQMLGTENRRRRFGRLETFAARYGIALHVCSCKNPDLGSLGCHIAGPSPRTSQTQTLPLFDPKQP